MALLYGLDNSTRQTKFKDYIQWRLYNLGIIYRFGLLLSNIIPCYDSGMEKLSPALYFDLFTKIGYKNNQLYLEVI